MQYPPGFFPHAVGSFQSPVKPPDLPPDDPKTQICVSFSSAWLPYVIGALSQLLLQSTWEGDDSEIEDAQINAMLLRYMFSTPFACGAIMIAEEYVSMPEFRTVDDQDKPWLEWKTDVVPGEWQRLAPESTVTPNGQPGGEGGGQPQPQPGGGSQCYVGGFSANGQFLVPVVVSTGDIITLDLASGAGNDGGSTTWYCPDGNVFFAGACVPDTKAPVGGDPASGVAHMALIALIAGVYYDLSSPVTVPSGVSNEQVVVQVNDSGLTNNQGSYAIRVCVQNNTPAAWTHVFDLTTTSGGWVVMPHDSGVPGVWTPGTGWVAADAQVGGDGQFYHLIEIHRTFPSRTITDIEFIYDLTKGTSDFDSTALVVQLNPFGSPTTPISQPLSALVNGTNQVANASGLSVTATEIFLELLSSARHSSYGGGTAIIKSIHISGTGTDPF